MADIVSDEELKELLKQAVHERKKLLPLFNGETVVQEHCRLTTAVIEELIERRANATSMEIPIDVNKELLALHLLEKAVRKTANRIRRLSDVGTYKDEIAEALDYLDIVRLSAK